MNIDHIIDFLERDLIYGDETFPAHAEAMEAAQIIRKCLAAGFLAEDGVAKVLGGTLHHYRLADGPLVSIGCRVYFHGEKSLGDKSIEWGEVKSIDGDGLHFRPLQRIRWMVPELCYSTHEAAKAAKVKA